MKRRERHNGVYQIRVREKFDSSLAEWMEDITIIPKENGETLLVGKFLDQAALRGFIDTLWNLNFTILSIEKIDK